MTQEQPEHAVIIHVSVSNDGLGTSNDQDAASLLEEQLVQVLTTSNCGEFDGIECGEGEIVYYIYGSNADRLFAVVEPVLRAAAFTRIGYAIKRYGPPGSTMVRVDF